MECKSVHDSDNLTVDHMIPKILGGSNELDNQRLLCLKCHKEKNKFECKVRELVGKMIFTGDSKAKEELVNIYEMLKLLHITLEQFENVITH